MSDANAIPLPNILATDPSGASTNTGAEASAPTRQATATPNDSTDEQLILALRDGSEPAFTTLFHRYQQPLFGFFSRRLSDSARAEELTQETFIALFRAAKRYQPTASFRTYLYAIAFRILRSDRRKSLFRAAFFGSPKGIANAATRSHTEDSLWVRRALAQLEPTDREIVMLREYQQLTYAEIAEILRIPLNTVRSRLFRARAALRNRLIPPPSAPRSSSSAPQPSPPIFGSQFLDKTKGQQQ